MYLKINLYTIDCIDYQFGVSYDVTTSKLKQANDKPNTYELSLIIRGRSKPSFVIPCPWK